MKRQQQRLDPKFRRNDPHILEFDYRDTVSGKLEIKNSQMDSLTAVDRKSLEEFFAGCCVILEKLINDKQLLNAAGARLTDAIHLLLFQMLAAAEKLDQFAEDGDKRLKEGRDL